MKITLMLEPLGSSVVTNVFGPADRVGVATEFDILDGDFRLGILIMPDLAHLYIDSGLDSDAPHPIEYDILTSSARQQFERELGMVLVYGYKRRTWRGRTLDIEVHNGPDGFKYRNHPYNLLPRHIGRREVVRGILDGTETTNA